MHLHFFDPLTGLGCYDCLTRTILLFSNIPINGIHEPRKRIFTQKYFAGKTQGSARSESVSPDFSGRISRLGWAWRRWFELFGLWSGRSVSRLGQHFYLALPLAILTAVTVFIISASYSQIIELFPTGGGGYLVATKLLGARAGLVSGSALVVDYMLTITISIASSADALFSFLPGGWQLYKLIFEVLLIFGLIFLNLRGVRESVMFMLPIFLLFIVMHIVVITMGVVPHAADMPALVANSYQEVNRDVTGLGLLATMAILLHAYSLGGGTYTGIEAVSNGLQILREPRVVTGKKTMLYMATSLAFTAGGILLCYLLNRVMHEPGKTLNASLFADIYGAFFGGDSTTTARLVIVTLITEAALLIVAAQAGFLDGPRVLSNMSLDSWAPHRLSHLSDQLVTRNGVWFMGIASLAFLIYSHGAVKLLVVMYSINVFLTFTLSQLGMCRHWWEVRRICGAVET